MKSLYAMLLAVLVWSLAGPAPAQGSKDNNTPAKKKVSAKKRRELDLENSRSNPVILHAFRDIVRKPSDYTVRVLADGKPVAFGIVVGADGYILTKWSEVRDRRKIVCQLKDGRELAAKLIGVKDDKDASYDLAMLKIDTRGLPTVEWEPSSAAKVGRWVASVGIGEDPVAIGIVSVATRPYKLGDQPLKNVNANAGWLGVGLGIGEGGGAQITKIDTKSPAERAGLKVKDVIYEAAGRAVADPEGLINALGRYRAGDRVLLKIHRDDEDLDVNITLGKRPRGQNFGINPQETMGSILSNRRGEFPYILQHDTVLNPADCGGPLVDLQGKTVGINIARAGRTETYAIPSEKVIPLLTGLKSGKLLPKEKTSKAAPPADPNQILRTLGSLEAGDKTDKNRQGLKANRLMKVHEVTLRADTTYAIDLESNDFDAYLVLEDAKGELLAKDDDSGKSPNARITFTSMADGVYRIIATSFDANEKGSYTLTVRKQDKPTKEKKE